jgi:hypothetical protein
VPKREGSTAEGPDGSWRVDGGGGGEREREREKEEGGEEGGLKRRGEGHSVIEMYTHFADRAIAHGVVEHEEA